VRAEGPGYFGGYLQVHGASLLNSDLEVTGSARLKGKKTVISGSATIETGKSTLRIAHGVVGNPLPPSESAEREPSVRVSECSVEPFGGDVVVSAESTPLAGTLSFLIPNDDIEAGGRPLFLDAGTKVVVQFTSETSHTSPYAEHASPVVILQEGCGWGDARPRVAFVSSTEMEIRVEGGVSDPAAELKLYYQIIGTPKESA